MVTLVEENLRLTSLWYGKDKGNISAYYTWFVQAHLLSGVVAYDFDSIPVQLSPDGWVKNIDGDTRAKKLRGLGQRDQQRRAR